MFDAIVIADLSDEEAPPAPPEHRERPPEALDRADAASDTFTDERAFVVLESCVSYEW
jgi:hypothetical protein